MTMKIEDIVRHTQGRLLCGELEREISEYYIGDFLSHVIGRAPSGCCWMTIMNNINVVGAAVMADISAIIICEDIEPVEALVAKCREEGIALISSPLDAFGCAYRICLGREGS